MVKIRLRRMGYKKNPIYRIVVINSSNRREGTPIKELGFYNPKTKEMKLDKATALEWISKGAQTSETVAYLLKNCDDEGKLIYKAKKTTKLSKKAQAKAEAEAQAKKEAEEAAAQAAEAEAPAEKEAEEAATETAETTETTEEPATEA